jgi:hypothetical protein
MDLKQTPYLVGMAAAAVLVLHSVSPAPRPLQPDGHATPPSTAGEPENGSADQPPGTSREEVPSAHRHYERLYREFLGVGPPVSQPRDVVQVRGSVAQEAVRLDISAKPTESPVEIWQLPRIAEAARDQRYRLEFLTALVADPIDSGLAADFDLELRALQSALADAGYQLDRHWLPWTDSKAIEDRSYRETAGIMLFRRAADRDDCSATARGDCNAAKRGDRNAVERDSRGALLAVFVVGETPKQGIHKRAFQSAVSFVLGLHGAACTAFIEAGPPPPQAPRPDCEAAARLEIPVLGPTYSGAAESLRLAIAAAPPSACFRVVSGSAAAPEVGAVLGTISGERVRFSRTILDEETLAETALHYLRNHLGWSLDRAVLLIENDTVYGNSVLSLPETGPTPLLAGLTKVRFPTELYGLRNAWEAIGADAQPATEGSAYAKAFAMPKTSLDVSLADRQPPVDVVSELSPLSTRIYDVTIGDLGRQLSRERFSYVGILATDVKDELFLAEQVRRWIPGAILFVFEGNLLYVHPQYNQAMFGTLAISSFPLVAEGATRRLSPATPDSRFRRQFASELQEGVYLAAGSLLGKDTPAPTVWISASGNYALWPVAQLTPDISPPRLVPWNPPATPLGPRVREASAAAGEPPLAPAGLQLLIILLLLCLANRQLRRDALLPQEVPAAPQQGVRFLLSLGLGVLCLVGALVVALDVLPIWMDLVRGLPPPSVAVHPVQTPPAATAWPRWGNLAAMQFLSALQGRLETVPKLEWLLLAALVAAYAYLVHGFRAILCLYEVPAPQAPYAASPPPGEPSAAGIALRAAAYLLAAIPFLAPALRHDSFVDLFYLRARAFSGGLSPLVLLAWLGAAGAFWLYVEVQRRLLRDRIFSAWPLADLENDREPHLVGCRRDAGAIESLLQRRVPFGARWGVGSAILVALLTLSLADRMQPIAESRFYGCCFLILGEVATVLSLISFIRFLRIWYLLRRMLWRIGRTSMLPALQKAAHRVSWNPTQFGYYVPTLPAMKPSVDLLDEIIDSHLACNRLGQPLCHVLTMILDAACERRLSEEIELRDRLNTSFTAACRDLASLQNPIVEEFYAVRVIAYVHRVFVQLRYSVMGAVGTCLAVIVAAATYAFEPKSSTLLVLCVTLATMSAATMAVFVQMERDTTLSAIGRTTAGQITHNWSFWSKILIYGVVPILGLAASQFPALGRLTGGLLDMLGRVVGGG